MPDKTQPTNDQPQKTQPTNTGAIGGVVASVAGLVLSFALAPLSLVMGLVVLVLGIRALRSGHPDRGWWLLATALALVCTLSSAAFTVYAFAR